MLNVYSWPGLILVMALSSVPFKFLLLVGAFQAMDRALEEAAQTSGAGRLQTILRVDLPMLAPTILGVLILGFVRALQAFEIPLFLGFPAKIQVLSTRIYDYMGNFSPPRYAEAGALSVTVVATLMVLVYVQARLLHGRDFVTVTGKGYRPGCGGWARRAISVPRRSSGTRCSPSCSRQFSYCSVRSPGCSGCTPGSYSRSTITRWR